MGEVGRLRWRQKMRIAVVMQPVEEKEIQDATADANHSI
jgi:hypothetical protein